MAKLKTLNDLEAFLIGLEIEKNGYALYKKAAETALFSDISKTFSNLADMELDHIETFKAIINEKKENKNFLTSYENDEALTYVSQIMDIDIFASLTPDKIIEEAKTVEEVLKVALEIEKNSILFYTEMKNISHNDEAINIFNRLLTEEKLHFVLISKLIK